MRDPIETSLEVSPSEGGDAVGSGSNAPKLSVIVPARRGGALLERVACSVLRQRTALPFELWIIDSGSSPNELERLRELGACVKSISPESFDHGATRDLGANLASGEVLVFLNQDALPVDEFWLERLVAPFFSPRSAVAVQGGIREFPVDLLAELGRRRFFWDSCGPRFYFTSESRAWIARHHGIGFSTINCALARSAWRELPFGRTPILEDKKWQAAAMARGWRIEEAPAAAVWHTHDYGFPGLLRRCSSEGFGWRLVGERYPLRTALSDMAQRGVWKQWRAGLRSAEIRRPSEFLFPVVRPLALWWGNQWARRTRA